METNKEPKTKGFRVIHEMGVDVTKRVDIKIIDGGIHFIDEFGSDITFLVELRYN